MKDKDILDAESADYKLKMFKFEYVDNEFKLLNIDVLVLFKFERRR